MKIFEFISTIAIPFFLLIVILYGIIEKCKVFDVFLEGAKEGIEIVVKIFPSLIGLFVAIGVLRSSGIIDIIIKILSPIINLLSIPAEIMPLALLRPISGSASIAIATNIMNLNGVDSIIGKTASTIMGSTETTLYTIAIYTGTLKIKKTRGILFAALLGDMVRNACVCMDVSNYVVKFLLTILGNYYRIKTNLK